MFEMKSEEEDDSGVSRLLISDLPEELLECILYSISAYGDLKCAMQVNRLWCRIVRGVVQKKKQCFFQSIKDRRVYWEYTPPESGPRITERYFHSACYMDKSMYVFGGCTPTSTAFNDLWRFDLASRLWTRQMPLGSYPSPKACASMVVYNNTLVLFGGWSHPTPYPLHQAAHFFNQLHVYSDDRWLQVTTDTSPPPTAGHSASVIGDNMIVFGGSHGLGTSCNELWLLDLINMNWRQVETKGPKPRPRYGHTQVVVDDKHILVLGGSGGPNSQFNDVWMLSMARVPWKWFEITVLDIEHSPPPILSHAGCKVGDKIVFLSKSSKPLTSADAGNSPSRDTGNIPSNDSRHHARNLVDHRFRRPSQRYDGANQCGSNPELPSTSQNNVPPLPNKRHLDSSESSEEESDTASSRHPSRPRPSRPYAGLRPGMPSIRPNSMKDRQKQLEALQRYEERFRGKPAGSASQETSVGAQSGKNNRNVTQLHVLDIDKVVLTCTVRWLPVVENLCGTPPDETIFYSLIQGRGELIMFGGLLADLNSMQRGVSISSHDINGGVFFITPMSSQAM